MEKKKKEVRDYEITSRDQDKDLKQTENIYKILTCIYSDCTCYDQLGTSLFHFYSSDF